MPYKCSVGKIEDNYRNHTDERRHKHLAEELADRLICKVYGVSIVVSQIVVGLFDFFNRGYLRLALSREWLVNGEVAMARIVFFGLVAIPAIEFVISAGYDLCLH